MNYSEKIRPRDVSEKMFNKQRELLLALSPEARLRIALQLMEDGLKLMVAGVKHEFPEANEEELKIHVLSRLKRHNPEKLKWIPGNEK